MVANQATVVTWPGVGGKPLFGMGITDNSIEALITREDGHVNDSARRAITQKGRGSPLGKSYLRSPGQSRSSVGHPAKNGFCCHCGARRRRNVEWWGAATRIVPTARTPNILRTDPVVLS